jgi:hypothetical protein
MGFLLSGFIGALIATLLSVVYLYISEQSRLRSEVALEVISYFDDIYKRLEALHNDKDSIYTGKKRGLTDEEYRIISWTLKDLLVTSKVGAKLEIIYGEGNFTGSFNYLEDSCCEAAKILWSAAKHDWDEKNKQIFILFEKKIDPARKSLERALIDGTRAHRIIKDFGKQYIDVIFKRG